MKDYDEILVALRQITRALDLYSKRLQRDIGLTTSQLSVLQSIDRLDKPTPGAVAKEIVLSQAAVTNLVDRLQSSNYVARQKLGTDKRTVNLVLTPKGESTLSSAPELMQTEFLNRYRSLENWEQQMLVASLGRIATMMNVEDIDASTILTPDDPNPDTL